MSFIYPLGLLGLIGIPIVIIIYIIKNKYTEQIVTSTYLWHLSEKFLKKKRQRHLISGLISLILQIIAITAVSLIIAHPVITLPDVANNYCFILDSSASMQTIDNDASRFEIGKDKIKSVIKNAANGSTYTLVNVASDTHVVYEKLNDSTKAIEMLEKLEPEDVKVSYNNAYRYAQEYYNNNEAVITYLITDRDFASSNVNVINVAKKYDNYAITNLDYTFEKNTLTIISSVVSYESDAVINVLVYVDDNLISEESVNVKKQEQTEFTSSKTILDFSNIKVEIKNKDGLTLDNKLIKYNSEKAHDYTTLIVSAAPFYLKSAIETVGNTSIQVISPENYSDSISGYSLYVFDGFAPSKLPTDGTIWLFGIESSIENSGFSVQNVIEDEDGLLLSYPKNSTTIYKTLTADLLKDDIYVSKYIKYGLYRNFTTLLTHEGNPVIFTGNTDNGNREIVFAFDLHNSNLPLLMDYLLLSKNLLDYSFPIIIEESSYKCGETALINVLGDFNSIRVESPKGNISYLDISSSIAELEMNEVGVYKLFILIGEESKEFSLYASLNEEESMTKHEELEFSLTGNTLSLHSDGIYDKLIIFFIVLAVIIVADWMVYCYEQHQLR